MGTIRTGEFVFSRDHGEVDYDLLLSQIKVEDSMRQMDPLDEFVNWFPLNRQTNCGILLVKGRLTVERCLVNLR